MKNLASALLRAQKNIKNVVKEANNPFFKSKYASLENVMDACKDELNNQGIVVLQPVGFDDNGNFVETTFLHAESGEERTSRMRLLLDKEDMQKLGSAISYARRYLLQSMAFLGGEDDDGEKTMDRPSKSPVPKAERASFVPKAAAATSNEGEW